MSITWGLARTANAWAPRQTNRIRNSGGGAQETGLQTALQGNSDTQESLRTMGVIQHVLPKRKNRKKSSVLMINKVIFYKLAKHEYCERRT